MIVDIATFAPAQTKTVPISVTSTAATTQVQAAGSSTQSTMKKLRIYNAGPNVAFILGGNSSPGTAAAPTSFASPGDLPIAPGSVEVFQMPVSHLSCVCKSGETATLYVTPGEGN